MASVSFLARSVARRSVDKLVRVNPQQGGVASSLLGSVRWSTSYFTPGKKRIANKQEPACLPACQLPKASYALGTGSTLRCKEINWEIRARPFPPEFSLEFWRLQCPCTLGVLFNCWCLDPLFLILFSFLFCFFSSARICKSRWQGGYSWDYRLCTECLGGHSLY